VEYGGAEEWFPREGDAEQLPFKCKVKSCSSEWSLTGDIPYSIIRRIPNPPPHGSWESSGQGEL
jgi:hypothetical protein